MIVITGTGRCGTGWASKTLTEVGVQCGHEKVFTLTGRDPHPTLPADASWMAPPHLEGPDHVILLYRSPELVVGSILGAGFFDHPKEWQKPYLEYMLGYVPELEGLGAFDAAVQFWLRWNRLLLPRADAVMNVHRPDWAYLGALAGVSEDTARSRGASVPTDYNTRRRVTVPRTDLPPEVWDLYAWLEGRALA